MPLPSTNTSVIPNIQRQASTTSNSNTNPIINNNKHSQHSTAYSKSSKKPPLFTRLPKCDANSSFSLVFQFIFEDNEKYRSNLAKIQEILAAKKSRASIISKNLELTSKFLETMTFNESSSQILDKLKVLRSLEFLLTFLGSFFGGINNNNDSRNYFGPQPATLKFKIIHYLQVNFK